MANTWVTDIRHFLGADGLFAPDMPGPRPQARRAHDDDHRSGDSLEGAAPTKAQQRLIDDVRGGLAKRMSSVEVRAPIDTSIDTHRVRGLWHIDEMQMGGADYLHMEVRAFVKLGTDNIGSFQFGLVRGDIDCEAERGTGGEACSSPRPGRTALPTGRPNKRQVASCSCEGVMT